jgi:hypothetical protein
MLLSKSLLPNSVCFSVGFSSVVIQGVKMILQGQQLHRNALLLDSTPTAFSLF